MSNSSISSLVNLMHCLKTLSFLIVCETSITKYSGARSSSSSSKRSSLVVADFKKAAINILASIISCIYQLSYMPFPDPFIDRPAIFNCIFFSQSALRKKLIHFLQNLHLINDSRTGNLGPVDILKRIHLLL